MVFDHYRQFIDTAQEVSSEVSCSSRTSASALDLERDIYQLSMHLSSQKNLIENLMETSGQERRSSCSASVHSSDPSHNPLQSLMHKIDGIAVRKVPLPA